MLRFWVPLCVNDYVQGIPFLKMEFSPGDLWPT